MSSINFDSSPNVGLLSSTPIDAPAAPAGVQPVADIDAIDNGSPAGLAYTTAAPSALTVSAGEIDGTAPPADVAYAAWQEGLTTLANESYPSVSAMLALAEVHGIPQQTAVQDIVDALGITHAAENDPFLQGEVADLLVGAGDIPREQLASQLGFMSRVANHYDSMGGGQRNQRMDRLYREYVNRMHNAMRSGNVDAAQAEFKVRFEQAEGLDALEQSVRNSVRSFGGVSDAEAAGIVDQCAAIQGVGEAADHVSGAEADAIVAGVAARAEADRTAALATIAQEMLTRQAGGTLTIDPALQAAVEAAAAAG
ncbi:MAG: hypothetical protein ACAI38_08050 [Myxococcota bacterium]